VTGRGGGLQRRDLLATLLATTVSLPADATLVGAAGGVTRYGTISVR